MTTQHVLADPPWQEEQSRLDPALPEEDPERQRLIKEIELQASSQVPCGTFSCATRSGHCSQYG